MDPAAVKELEVLASLKAIDEATEKGNSSIQQFYEDAVILLTGGSGFMGKQLIEKLFRSCNIKKMYLLLRPKKGRTIEHRLAKILENPVFDSVRQKKPEFLERLVPIQGDMIELELGLNEDNWRKLTDEVDIIFHTAATVNFNEKLRTATLINIRGTMEILKFGKACKNLRSFVYVSTAFSQSTDTRKRSVIREEFYPSTVPPNTLVELAEIVDESTLERIAPIFKQDGGNSYTLTKAVAEEVVRTMSGDLPICIVRPAIVIGSYHEPAPGWVDINNVYGPSGIILGVGLGVMHTLLSKKDIRIDLVPVDLANNGVIVAGWKTGTRIERDVKIYTITAARNYITWKFLTDVIENELRKYVTPMAVWYGFAKQTSSKYYFVVLTWLLHFIPGALIDLIFILMRKKPIALKNYLLMFNLTSVMQHFTCNYWIYDDENFVKMYESMSEIDKKIFNVDIMSVDMKEMIIFWYIGLRKYIIKDGLKGNANAVKKQVFLRIATYVLTPLYSYSLYKLFAFIFCILFKRKTRHFMQRMNTYITPL